MREVEPIIPLHMLIDRGYRLTWKPGHCSIDHPVHGRVERVLRAGCPVMRRKEALQLIDQFEKDEKNYMGWMNEELKSWWKGHFPEMPERLLRYMRGQGQDPHQRALPWNRRQRRSHLRGNGVIIHLFAGKKASEWEKTTIEGCQVIAVDTEMGSQFNLHAPEGLCLSLWWLVEQGVVRAIVGGPPCRTTSRLRNQAPPGPRPLRDRDDLDGAWMDFLGRDGVGGPWQCPDDETDGAMGESWGMQKGWWLCDWLSHGVSGRPC